MSRRLSDDQAALRLARAAHRPWLTARTSRHGGRPFRKRRRGQAGQPSAEPHAPPARGRRADADGRATTDRTGPCVPRQSTRALREFHRPHRASPCAGAPKAKRQRAGAPARRGGLTSAARRRGGRSTRRRPGPRAHAGTAPRQRARIAHTGTLARQPRRAGRAAPAAKRSRSAAGPRRRSLDRARPLRRGGWLPARCRRRPASPTVARPRRRARSPPWTAGDRYGPSGRGSATRANSPPARLRLDTSACVRDPEGLIAPDGCARAELACCRRPQAA